MPSQSHHDIVAARHNRMIPAHWLFGLSAAQAKKSRTI
jgi:hypothetical protein